MPDSLALEQITQARRAFFGDGIDPQGLVPEDIRASWLRCQRLGLQADQRPGLTPVEHPTLHEIQQRHERLRRLCRPELEALHVAADRAHSIVILTAPDGYILDALGDASFLDKAARVALCPGSQWDESAIGTNAIGTTLVEERPVEVKGAEHYYRVNRVLSCSATPLFDPRGEVLGALDLSGEASTHHPLALSLVQYAAAQIECRLFAQEFDAAHTLRIDSAPDLTDTPHTGLLALHGTRIIAANRRAMHLLGIDRQALGRVGWSSLFATPWPLGPQISEVTTRRGGHRLYLQCSARPSARVTGPAAAARQPEHRDAPRFVFTARLDADIDRAARLLDADIPILLQGETGVGKEVTAHEIHRRSAHAHGAFVPVNCAALPASLIEAELFGYQPGAFTGARREGSKGLLRSAAGGTIFLDEIGDMPLELQTRLLRVLQEREVTPIGGNQAIPVDFRVISATHEDVAQQLPVGRFRADLYYRIAQSVVHLPPLRDYANLGHVIAQLWEVLGGPQRDLKLDAALVTALANQPWPGNLRQLTGVLRSLLALGQPGSTLAPDDLPPELGVPAGLQRPAKSTPADPVVSSDLRSIEARAMNAALEASHGNVAAAARALGVSRSTLYRRLGASVARG
ncbi:MAG TPA: sigma-54-dependent Fis family transcriptional regulator [Nevskiaceae bacterium]|nr:sigma-54-dependent Fis family transcriptional regulator [Nevskiaceae bacterium]